MLIALSLIRNDIIQREFWNVILSKANYKIKANYKNLSDL